MSHTNQAFNLTGCHDVVSSQTSLSAAGKLTFSFGWNSKNVPVCRNPRGRVGRGSSVSRHPRDSQAEPPSDHSRTPGRDVRQAS